MNLFRIWIINVVWFVSEFKDASVKSLWKGQSINESTQMSLNFHRD